MQNWSIVTKIVFSTGGIISLLLIVGSLGLLSAEKELVTRLTERHIDKINEMIDEREQSEKTMLQKNIRFNTDIFAKVIAGHLFRYSTEHLKRDMQVYMEYPEIVAIQVFDEDGMPFASAWKTPEIVVDDALADEVSLEGTQSVEVDLIFDEELYGLARIYYSESLLQSRIQEMRDTASQQTSSFRAESEELFSKIASHQGLGVLFILITQICCLIMLMRVLILKPLYKIFAVAQSLAKLDLTVDPHIDRRDEIGRLFACIHDIAEVFRTIVAQVKQTGVQVSSSSTELVSTARQQEATMTNQLASTKQVVTSVQEISEVGQDLVNTMQQLAHKVQESAEVAAESQSGLSHMKDAMYHMEKASKSISSRLETINQKTEKITTVVTTINKVSEQTNLLSLNAAIEAEKAGEYGRGFSVVAREIRRLADQTAVATLNIEYMVQQMQSAVASGIMEMDKFVADVRRSAEEVGDISVKLALIIEQVQVLKPGFEHVNAGTGQQAEHAQRINLEIQQLTEDMEQTRDSLRESYSAIENLNGTVLELENEVSRFKLS